MIRDAWTVGQHEMHSIINSLYPSIAAFLTFGLILILFGIVVPVGLVDDWMNATGYLFLWFWLAWLLIAGPISDAFAGERERQTLPTIYSSRLPTGSILAGKVFAVTAYGLVLSMVALIVSTAIVYLSEAGWSDHALQPAYLKAAAILMPLSVLLAASSGALISLNARTARQAHQVITIIAPATIVFILALGRLLEITSPTVYTTLSLCVLPLSCSPIAMITTAGLMTLLIVGMYALASIRIRVKPA